MSKRPSTADHDRPVTEAADSDPFLSRWSRRKRAVKSGGDPDAAAGEPAPAAGLDENGAAAMEEPAPAGDEVQAPELTDEDMPPLEAIDENTDMRGFFSPKVSQAVKKAALRKFFHNPAFNVVDGLDDYDDDFRSFAALGDIVTSDMRGQMDREAERVRKSMARDEPPGEPMESDDAGPQQAVTEDVDEEPIAGESAGAAERADAGDGDDVGAAESTAAAQPGISGEAGAQARMLGGKLRPKGAGGEDA
jgi:hypothetical protein